MVAAVTQVGPTAVIATPGLASPDHIADVGRSPGAISTLATQKSLYFTLERYIEEEDEVEEFLRRVRPEVFDEVDDDRLSNRFELPDEKRESALDMDLPLQMIFFMHRAGKFQRLYEERPFFVSGDGDFEKGYFDDPRATYRYLGYTLELMEETWPEDVVAFVRDLAIVDYGTACACLTGDFVIHETVRLTDAEVEMTHENSGSFPSAMVHRTPPIGMVQSAGGASVELLSVMDRRAVQATRGRPMSPEHASRYSQLRENAMRALAEMDQFTEELSGQ